MYSVIKIGFTAPDFEYGLVKSNLPSKEAGDQWITDNIDSIDVKIYWVVLSTEVLKFRAKVRVVLI